ncbi:MAG TPA: chemotaxis protein CheB [Terriglobales bacterium]|nr:chemotaxis protein CheB [Terriglobales bacterium]
MAARNHTRSRSREIGGEAPRAPRRYDVVAIGASAGGLSSIKELLKPLPEDFPAAMVIVQHLARQYKSHLTEVVSRVTALRVKDAEHDEVLLPGVVYMARPDEHLLVGPGKLQLAHTQLVHFLRPSIDLMFESVAGTYGSRSIAVVLSGTLHDGAKGLRTIKLAGGTTIAENPDQAEFKSMPQAAVDTGCVDLILPVGEIGVTLIQLCCGDVGD